MVISRLEVNGEQMDTTTVLHALLSESTRPAMEAFTGRDREMEFLRHATDKSGAVIGLFGKAGVGKTTILRAFVEQNAHRWPSRSVEYSVSANCTPALLGLIQQSAGNKTLFVIDDLERLSTADARLVMRELRRHENLTVLIGARAGHGLEEFVDDVLSISPLPLSALFGKRLQMMGWQGDIDEFCRFVERSPLFESLRGEPRKVVKVATILTPEFEKSGSVSVPAKWWRWAKAQYRRIGWFEVLFAVAVLMYQTQCSDRFESGVGERFTRLESQIHSLGLEGISRSGLNTHLVIASARVYSDLADTSLASAEVLPVGEHVDLLQVSRGWARVLYKTSSGEGIGWVDASCIGAFSDGHPDQKQLPSPEVI